MNGLHRPNVQADSRSAVPTSCRRRIRRLPPSFQKPDFRQGDMVRSLTPVVNDGTYPHRDIGEIMVWQGDRGVVRERWSFLGETYCTVEFMTRAAIIIMRARELAPAAG